MTPLSVGSLFSGIGGFDLGFERAGMQTLWFCEQDKFCQKVLAKHWPGVPCHPDVRALVADADRQRQLQPQGIESHQWRRTRDRCIESDYLSVPVPYVDVLCGGFPCQDISTAGKGVGLSGSRSGLWSEFARLIGELRPRYVVVENVPVLRSRGFGRILGEMATLGYDAEWDCLPASAFGAPHRRDRVWIVAYDQSNGCRSGWPRRFDSGGTREQQPALQSMVDAGGTRRPHIEGGAGSPEPDRWPIAGTTDALRWSHDWLVEPDVGRVAHGVPARVDRLRSLGNSLVPQISEWLGRRIVAYEQGLNGDHC